MFDPPCQEQSQYNQSNENDKTAKTDARGRRKLSDDVIIDAAHITFQVYDYSIHDTIIGNLNKHEKSNL